MTQVTASPAMTHDVHGEGDVAVGKGPATNGTLWTRQCNTSSEELVGKLVCNIFEGIRNHIVQAAELKFNCFFLMPVVDQFPARLREELEITCEEVNDGHTGAFLTFT